MRSRTRVSISLLLIVCTATIYLAASHKRRTTPSVSKSTNAEAALPATPAGTKLRDLPDSSIADSVSPENKVIDQKISEVSTRIKQLEKNMSDERIKEQLNDPRLSDYLRDLYFQKIDELVQLDQQLYKLKLQKIAGSESQTGDSIR